MRYFRGYMLTKTSMGSWLCMGRHSLLGQLLYLENLCRLVADHQILRIPLGSPMMDDASQKGKDDK